IKDGAWEIPAENTKANRAHRVPLPALALRILEELKPVTGKSAYVFETSSRRKKGPIRWVSHATARIREGCGFHFRAHDLRRTCGTGMARLGVDRLTIAKALNHKSADASVTAIYDRYAREPEVRDAFERWSAHLEGVLAEDDESRIAGRIG
ncbi:MAG: tyrosine-type recombinase/integrase, partial [Gemmatimonadota bacterium]